MMKVMDFPRAQKWKPNMVIQTAQATASHPVFYWERQEYYSSILTLNLWKKKKKNHGNGISPWSKSSPNGLEEFVRLACFPSTASKV
jgi:hypothetical protein